MHAITNFIISPLAFLSGTFYTTTRLPETWQTVAHLNPFFYMLDGFRYGFIGHADGNLAVGMTVMIAMSVALSFAAYTLIRTGYRLKS
jgi:ABC-2 type transport system permease protein